MSGCVNIDLSSSSPSVIGTPPLMEGGAHPTPALSPGGRRLEEYEPRSPVSPGYNPESPAYSPSYSPSASVKENTPPGRDKSAVGPPRPPTKAKLVPRPAERELHPLALEAAPILSLAVDTDGLSGQVTHDYSPMPQVPTGLPPTLPLRIAIVQAKMDTTVSAALQREVSQGRIEPLHPVVRRAHNRALSSRSRAKREVANQEKRVTRFAKQVSKKGLSDTA